MKSSGAETGATHFHRKESLRPSGISEGVAENAGKGSKLKGIEVEKGGFEVKWVACSETVGEFRQGDAVAEEVVLYLSVVEGW